ncbi:MAG: glutamate--tRNA ligase [Acidobacteriaceae bacterium]|nr:glutamate--tRNA ligase [Acidobacteriaceae bacterium]MBV9501358.1 glutamate--tRNA ligase [Acidobacteriaceae bacterium]
MTRARFAPSPTGYLHIGSAHTFIFNWLYVRKHQGKLVLRIDDTDVDRNTQASLDSIYDGLNWLALGWDECYRESDRLEVHRKLADELLAKRFAYRDFTPAAADVPEDRPHGEGPWLCNPDMRALSGEESDRRAAAGEPFVIRFRVQRDPAYEVAFHDEVYGPQSKLTADIEDFALLRSNGLPTYHLASCADDIDMKITHVIRGQDHLSNTFKHILIFQGANAPLPRFAHLPLLIAPDGSKLSKRKHGPVVSVTTYRDKGFLAVAYINFLCLLGWSPKDNREQMTLYELTSAFNLDGVHRSNAVVNFSEADPIDPKALWLNSQHLRSIPVAVLAPLVRKTLEEQGLEPPADEVFFHHVIDTIRTRFSTLLDFATKGRAYFSDDYPIEKQALEKLDAPGARELLHELANRIESDPEFTEASVERDLRKLAEERGVKAGLIINSSRAALTGQPVGPSAFAVFTCIGRERVIRRLRKV